LAIALVVAPLLMIYPHLPGINPGGEGISTDEQYYLKWMTELRSAIANSDGTIFQKALAAFSINNGDRPIALLLILSISDLTQHSDLMVIRFLPVALAPSIVASNYLLLRHSLNTKLIGVQRVKVFAAIGSVFAAFSPQIVVGEYAGLLANWIALTLMYSAFFFLVRLWDQEQLQSIVVSGVVLSLILCLIMFVHLYTWSYILPCIVVFAGIAYIATRKATSQLKTKIIILACVIATSYVANMISSTLLDIPTARESVSALGSIVEPRDTTDRWERLNFTLSAYVGGFLSNAPLFLLSIVAVVRSKLYGLNILMFALISMLSVPLLIGSVEFQTRMLFNTPIHLAAVVALIWIGGELGRCHDEKLLQKLLIVTILLVVITFALRAMANLPLGLPDGVVIERQFLLGQG
jgi:hypothetical protein